MRGPTARFLQERVGGVSGYDHEEVNSHGTRLRVLPEMHAIFDLSLGTWRRSVGVRRLHVQAPEGGGVGVRDNGDVAIVVLLLIAVTCVTIFFLKLAEPTGGLVELLFPRV